MKIFNFNISNYSSLYPSSRRSYAAIALIKAVAATIFYGLTKLFGSTSKPPSANNVNPSVSAPPPLSSDTVSINNSALKTSRPTSSITNIGTITTTDQAPQELHKEPDTEGEDEFFDAEEPIPPSTSLQITEENVSPSDLQQFQSFMKDFGKINGDEENSLGDILLKTFFKDIQSCTMTKEETGTHYKLVFPSQKTLTFSRLADSTKQKISDKLGPTALSWIQQLFNASVIIAQELNLVVSIEKHSVTINFPKNDVRATKTIKVCGLTYSVTGILRSIGTVTDLNEHPGCKDYGLSDEDGPFVYVAASHDLPKFLLNNLATEGPALQSIFANILKDNFLTQKT